MLHSKLSRFDSITYSHSLPFMSKCMTMVNQREKQVQIYAVSALINKKKSLFWQQTKKRERETHWPFFQPYQTNYNCFHQTNSQSDTILQTVYFLKKKKGKASFGYQTMNYLQTIDLFVAYPDYIQTQLLVYQTKELKSSQRRAVYWRKEEGLLHVVSL